MPERSRMLAYGLAAGLLWLASCTGSYASTPVPPPTPTAFVATASPASSPPATPATTQGAGGGPSAGATQSTGLIAQTPTPSESGTVTLADDGQTIELHTGERFLLELGSDYDWTVTVADQNIVSRVVNVLVIRGAQGIYEAKQPGRTTLSATGDPPCRKAQPPCAAPSRTFRIDIVVR
ncbi:MAG: hypothetical protein M1531_00515 [Chloroflexi bacterium]|nr:hypothetical protein [Chloroflexota bacterium]